MILIPDIHINHKYADRILHELDTYILANSDEKDIVFLGDYIYMFNLDTNAINRLLDLIIKHFHSGKNIYILAGNHDWIGKDFVYHQAQKVFQILNKSSNNKIYFITEPMITNIGGQNIFFLPYMITKEFVIYDDSRDVPLEHVETNPSEYQNVLEQTEFELLTKHKNHNHQISGYINLAIEQVVKKYPDICIIHHYYIHDIALPGIKSRFDYSDVALSPKWLDNKSIKLISGHIHKAFQMGNYLCCGSIWHTASQESDQVKFLRKWNIGQDSFEATSIYINPYIEMKLEEDKIPKAQVFASEAKQSKENTEAIGGLFDFNVEAGFITTKPDDNQISDTNKSENPSNIYISENSLTTDMIDNKYLEIYETTRGLLGSNIYIDRGKYNHKDITINLHTDMDYEDLQSYLPKEIIESYQDIKIKKISKINKIAEIDISNLNLQYNYDSWQQIAKKYISEKYGDQSDIYINYLQRMNIGL